jgi:hypothetical protein
MMLDILQDLRFVLGPVRDQGRRPTCLSFAASAAHEQARGDVDPLCVEWLFYHAAHRAGTGPGEGTTLPDTRQILQDVGQPPEPTWPCVQPSPEVLQGRRWETGILIIA